MSSMNLVVDRIKLPKVDLTRLVSNVFSPDGGFVGMLVESHFGRVFDRNFREVDIPSDYPVTGMAFASRGSNHFAHEVALAHGRHHCAVRCFDLSSGREIRSLLMREACSVAYNGDGSMLAAGGSDGRVRVWRLERFDAGELMSLRVVASCIRSIAFNHRCDAVAVSTGDGRSFSVSLTAPYSVSDSICHGFDQPAPPDWSCTAVACHPTRPLLACAGRAGHVWLRDTETVSATKVATGVGDHVSQVQFSAEGEHMVVVGPQAVEVWRLDPLSLEKRVESAHPDEPAVAASMRRGRLLITWR